MVVNIPPFNGIYMKYMLIVLVGINSCVKGTIPKAGDRVLVEATYNANMPFKWNATRIQVLPGQVCLID